MPGYDLRIMDDNQKELAERQVGNIQFKGPSAMQGYYNNPVATQKAFHEGWWDTGDLGYVVGKEVFITGRKKDLIIKAGHNIFPEEIEEVVAHVAGIRKGCTVAFGVHEQKTGTEKLIIVVEVYDKTKHKKQQIRSDIIKEMVAILGITPDEILLVSPRTVPKTSSGKLQRSACKALYVHRKLTKYKLPVTLQMIKLTLESTYKKISGWMIQSAKLVYTVYIAVDRADFAKSLEIKDKVGKSLQQGNSVVIFPEGRFSYATGLRPFRLGAFSISVETGMPICSVAVNGMRRILRGVEKLVRPGLIQVTIGDPIYPNGHDWSEVARLHGLVRADIAKHCGEPVIDLVSVGPAVL